MLLYTYRVARGSSKALNLMGFGNVLVYKVSFHKESTCQNSSKIYATAYG